MSDKKIKVKSQTKTIKDDKDDKLEYEIKVDKEQELNFGDKPKKDQTKSINDLDIQIRKKGDGDDKWENAKIKPTFASGWFITDVEFKDEIKGLTITVTPKEKRNFDVKGYEWGFLIGIVVFVLLVAGLGWWWYSSSKNQEDEEEAGL